VKHVVLPDKMHLLFICMQGCSIGASAVAEIPFGP